MTYEELVIAEREAKQKEHDRTNRHVWADVSTNVDTQRKFICLYCTATMQEPYHPEDLFDV